MRKLNLKKDRIVDIQKALHGADTNTDKQVDFDEWRQQLKKFERAFFFIKAPKMGKIFIQTRLRRTRDRRHVRPIRYGRRQKFGPGRTENVKIRIRWASGKNKPPLFNRQCNFLHFFQKAVDKEMHNANNAPTSARSEFNDFDDPSKSQGGGHRRRYGRGDGGGGDGITNDEFNV